MQYHLSCWLSLGAVPFMGYNDPRLAMRLLACPVRSCHPASIAPLPNLQPYGSQLSPACFPNGSETAPTSSVPSNNPEMRQWTAARQLRESPLRPPAPQQVMVVSAAHDYHCKYPKGDYLNLLSAINKQVSFLHILKE